MIRPNGLLGSPAERQRKRLRGLLQSPAVEPVADPAKQTADPWTTDRGEASKDGSWGKSYDQMTAQELNDAAKSAHSGNIIERNIGSLAGLLGPLGAGFAFNALDSSLMSAALANAGLANPGDYVDGKVAGAANTGMNMAGGAVNPELAGRNGGSLGASPEIQGPALDSGNAGAWGGSGEKLAKGGIVKRKGLIGPDPEGPDEGYAALKGGERVLNEAQYAKLSPSAKKEVDALMRRAEKAKRK